MFLLPILPDNTYVPKENLVVTLVYLLLKGYIYIFIYGKGNLIAAYVFVIKIISIGSKPLA